MMDGSISVTDLDDALAELKRLGPQSNAALALALNEVGTEAVKQLQSEALAVFDRPTPFTINAFRVLYAKASRPEAAVWIKDEKSGAGGGQAPEAWLADGLATVVAIGGEVPDSFKGVKVYQF